jgi:antitoxin FitA
MSVNLSIKNVPEALAMKLRDRAKRHHRSLQGELMALLEHSTAEEETITPQDLLARVSAMKLKTKSEAAVMVRMDRDGR